MQFLLYFNKLDNKLVSSWLSESIRNYSFIKGFDKILKKVKDSFFKTISYLFKIKKNYNVIKVQIQYQSDIGEAL